MAYFKITKSAKGELQARIQVSCKNTATGKKKIFTKRIYNKDKLTEAKFKKFVEKTSFEFEEKVIEEYERIVTGENNSISDLITHHEFYLSLNLQKNGDNL